jgi:hypothetical protein
MGTETNMTKQGVRDLNTLGPKRVKTADPERVEDGGATVQVSPEPLPAAAAAAVVPETH